jgi:hypothetical protein
MTRPAYLLLLSVGCLFALSDRSRAIPPTGPNPLTWQFAFTHSEPKRLVITPPGADKPQAYWYITYAITNPGTQARLFYPKFELVTEDGFVIRSDGKRYETVNGQVREAKRTVTIGGQTQEITDMVPDKVLSTIRALEKNPALQSVNQIIGSVRPGPDEAKQGVAIFPEPNPRMGRFAIFAAGLSGDTVAMKRVGTDLVPLKKDEVPDPTNKPIILQRTYQMRFHLSGDAKFPGDDHVANVGEGWIYR